MAGRTHYDVLGLRPDATGTAIREAYRSLAREHHPDRAVSASSARRGVTMPEINEAYRVLRDPGRRAVYDSSLRGTDHAADTTAAGTPRSDDRSATQHAATNRVPDERAWADGPARVPWRSMLFLALLGIVGVLALAQFTEPGEPPGPDGILHAGDCVQIGTNNDAFEVACTGDPATDIVVREIVPFDGSCPANTQPHRDRQGLGIVCVVMPIVVPPSS